MGALGVPGRATLPDLIPATTVRHMHLHRKTATLVLLLLVTAAASGCSTASRDVITADLAKFGADAAVAGVAAAIGADTQLVVGVDGRMPTAAVKDAVSAFRTVATINIPDADGDGFVDGNRIVIRIGSARSCIQFSTAAPATVACG